MMRRLRFQAVCMIIALAFPVIGLCQTTQDPFTRSVSGLRLENEPVINGIARICQAAGIALSIEYPLAESKSVSPPTLQRIQTEVDGGSVTDVLKRLIALDTSFTWQRTGNMINVFPSSTVADAHYVMNRTLEVVSYDQVADLEKAVFWAVGSLSPPKEQIAMMQTGNILAFPKPLSFTLHNVSIREVLDHLLEQIGPQYGWELSGSRDFRLLQFHSGYAR